MGAGVSAPVVTPDALVAAVRARGSDADDARDAAHEALHALRAGRPWQRGRRHVLADGWDREVIHAALVRSKRGRERIGAYLFAEEVLARAVERIVCRRVGHDIGDPEHWLFIAAMEGTKTGFNVRMADWREAADAVERSARAAEWADRVLALVSP